MNMETFAHLIASQEIDSIKLHRNPNKLDEWFPMIHCNDGTVHLLIDQQGHEISKTSLDALVSKLKSYGAQSAEVIL